MSVEIRSIPSNLHPQPRNFTTTEQEDAYYREHTLSLPRWLIASASLARQLYHSMAAAAHALSFHHPKDGSQKTRSADT